MSQANKGVVKKISFVTAMIDVTNLRPGKIIES